MIVGVAQLVLNVPDLEAEVRAHTDVGWTISFRSEGLPNHPSKRAFQAASRTTLDMVHLVKRGSTAIEITRYAGAPTAGTTVYELAGDRVRVVAKEPQASSSFWAALGFSERADGMLEAKAVLPDWRLTIELVPTDQPARKTCVDADGCVLVTVLTTSIETDFERLSATGLLVESASPWVESIAGRTTTVAMVRGPSGELVELLQAPRASRDE